MLCVISIIGVIIFMCHIVMCIINISNIINHNNIIHMQYMITSIHNHHNIIINIMCCVQLDSIVIMMCCIHITIMIVIIIDCLIM